MKKDLNYLFVKNYLKKEKLNDLNNILSKKT
jgi:hypothetical protein